MNAARGSIETAWNRVSTLTPCHFMSSFVHLVTQLMSTRYVFDGSLRNSSQLQLTGCRTNPSMVKRHWSSRIRGVGPADSTGQSSTRYWPGGIRPACSGLRRRPKNPRETNPSPMAPRTSLLALQNLGNSGAGGPPCRNKRAGHGDQKAGSHKHDHHPDAEDVEVLVGNGCPRCNLAHQDQDVAVY